MTQDAVMRRAEEAKEILSSLPLAEAFSDLEQAYVEALLECKKEDDLGRFRLSEGMKVLRLVKRQLEAQVEAGALAVHEVQELRRGGKGIW